MTRTSRHEPAAVVLETPSARRRDEFLQAVARSRTFHARWTAPPRTTAEFAEYLRRLKSAAHAGFLVRTGADELAGVINVNDIVRGKVRSADLGYYAFVPHDGRGYMSAGLRAVVSRAFGVMKLHRLEADIQPGNTRSHALVQGLGFEREGASPRSLRIAGRWRDHERWALTAEHWAR